MAVLLCRERRRLVSFFQGSGECLPGVPIVAGDLRISADTEGSFPIYGLIQILSTGSGVVGEDAETGARLGGRVKV